MHGRHGFQRRHAASGSCEVLSSPSRSQRSSQDWLFFPEEDLPLDQPAIAVDRGDVAHLLRGQGVADDALQIGQVIATVTEKGIGTWPRCTAHLTQTTRGMNVQPPGDLTITGSSISTVSSGVRSRSGRPGEPIGLIADGNDSFVSRHS